MRLGSKKQIAIAITVLLIRIYAYQLMEFESYKTATMMMKTLVIVSIEALHGIYFGLFWAGGLSGGIIFMK